MLENLTIILGVCFNSYLSSNYILKCHTGRDNQNDILIIKRKEIDIYMESRNSVSIHGSMYMSMKHLSQPIVYIKI